MKNDLLTLHYKETDPVSTVIKIRKILSRLHVTLDEICESRDFDCHSVRIVLSGSNIGTNGKGVSLQYARASAYAEFMERLENHILTNSMLSAKTNWKYTDERTLSWEALVRENNSFIQNLLKGCEKSKGADKEKVSFLSSISQSKGVACRKYYSIKEKHSVNVPVSLLHIFYTSNGMCAGNKPEEALSQGISEIVERYVMYQLFSTHPALPDIPINIIDQYPCVSKIFRALQGIKGYTCIMKDCSLGGRYSVAAFIMIKNDSGHYGIKFGSHPDIGIAMERAMTEAFQGRNEQQFSCISSIYFNRSYIESFFNIFNSYKTSTACYPPELFIHKNGEGNDLLRNAYAKSNREVLRGQLESILNQGYDILIKDVSYLGFSAYSVVVPGMSETLKPSALMMKANNSRYNTIRKFSNPKSITENDVEQILLTMEFYKSSILENSISSFYEVSLENYPFIANEDGLGIYFLLSLLYFIKKDYKNALSRQNLWLKGEKRLKLSEIKPIYRCIYKYIECRAEGYSHRAGLDILKSFFGEELISKVDYYFKESSSLLGKIYPTKKCEGAGENASDEMCDGCELKKYCRMNIINRIWASCQKNMQNFDGDNHEIKDLIIDIFDE